MKNRKNTCELLEKIPGYCVRVPCERCLLGGRSTEFGGGGIQPSADDMQASTDMKRGDDMWAGGLSRMK